MDTNEKFYETEKNISEGFKDQSLNRTQAADGEVPAESHTQQLPVRYAGFWMRFWAYLLDLIVIGSIVRLLINPLFRLLDISLAEYNMFAPISIASAVIFYLYFVLMTKFFQQTLGKMVFGLKVIDLKHEKLSWGTIIFREWIGRFISVTVLIGYLIVAFLPKKQGLHDIFTDTTVIHSD
ncbi:RDD family protein [Neobacillus sp. OS1-32]|uniref:RDD family protein n=1 Tax=Neobacillus paridis TaxID=2803862 RepID=A0ABS1TL82_9BACI|nr:MULTISPECIES: RDD family protein [Neobacillus]MBL4951948.1 RDD family protein [Neobacillus paridis]WML30448.1 RDD family protein [Neobacillus sp. OS1-32]